MVGGQRALVYEVRGHQRAQDFKALHKKKDRADCNNHSGISLVTHADKVLLKIVASRLSNCCDCAGVLPEEQARLDSGPGKLGRARKSPEQSFIDLQKAYYSVDRELLWVMLGRFVVPEKLLSVICQFHDGMQAGVRVDDGEYRYSEWLGFTQGLRQGCVLLPLLFNVLFAAAIHAVLVRFGENPDILRVWSTWMMTRWG